MVPTLQVKLLAHNNDMKYLLIIYRNRECNQQTIERHFAFCNNMVTFETACLWLAEAQNPSGISCNNLNTHALKTDDYRIKMSTNRDIVIKMLVLGGAPILLIFTITIIIIIIWQYFMQSKLNKPHDIFTLQHCFRSNLPNLLLHAVFETAMKPEILCIATGPGFQFVNRGGP